MELENTSLIFCAGRHSHHFVVFPHINSSPDDQGAQRGSSASSIPHLPGVMELLQDIISSKALLGSS